MSEQRTVDIPEYVQGDIARHQAWLAELEAQRDG